MTGTVVNEGNLAAKYGMNDRSLDLRREFLGITEKERLLMKENIPWITKAAPAIAKDFFDIQFNFAPTATFLHQLASSKGLEMNNMRTDLEKQCTENMIDMFQGSDVEWDGTYYDRRLGLGREYALTNFPLKWVSAQKLQLLHLIQEHRQRDCSDQQKVLDFSNAVGKVLIYDLQAVCDSFLLNIFEQMGLSLDQFPHEEEADKTEHFHVLRENARLLQAQAQSIADGKIDSEVLEEDIPGVFGEAFTQMKHRLIQIVGQISEASSALATASTELSLSSKQMSTSIDEITRNTDNAAVLSKNSASLVKNTHQLVSELGGKSADIGGVIKVIKGITDQTKVLSLNATIEGAKAGGQAGKGFSVVAREVKELSRATAEAAEDISKKIESIQSSTTQSVEATQQISLSIDEITSVSAMNAEAINKQNVSVQQIAQSATEVSRMAGDLERVISFFKPS